MERGTVGVEEKATVMVPVMQVQVTVTERDLA